MRLLRIVIHYKTTQEKQYKFTKISNENNKLRIVI